MSEYTEAEMANLSDEEREALMDGTDEERAALTEAVNEDDQEDRAKMPDEESSGDGESGDDEAKPNDEETGDGEDRQAFVPTYRADPVDDYDAKMASMDAKFEDGALGLKDYNQQRDALIRAQIKAEISAEQNAQIEAQVWEREISDFMDDHAEYKTSKLRHAALDVAVKDLASDPANSDKAGRWFLREAHKLVQSEFGSKQSENGAEEKTAPKSAPTRKPDLSVVPKTLGNLPQADGGNDAGEFDHLEKMGDMELERAVARMTPDQQARYLAA